VLGEGQCAGGHWAEIFCGVCAVWSMGVIVGFFSVVGWHPGVRTTYKFENELPCSWLSIS
jgi:hypothetical protein